MVYCVRCGKPNQDGAVFCSYCGNSLAAAAPMKAPAVRQDQCQEECEKGPRSGSVFWGILVILVGLWIVFELGVKNIQGVPQWLADFQFWWIFPLLIGLVVIFLGLRLMIRK